ncbi:MAG: Hsp33 family molecular chaperone HslO [Sphaerochaetaceae bacterium]|nr:Hsp33 family molecular chaperone HslO [Sphaerochaetaceae bacterium]
MIKANIEDQLLVKHLNEIAEDGRQVMLLADGQIRLTGLGGTTMVNQMRANFNLGVLETLVLGQAYIAAGLMASSVKGNDRIQLNVECGGPIGGIYVESWACGAVRGFIKNNQIPLDKPLESRDISLLYGPGFISVTKLLEGNRTPFTGQTMMQYGDLAKDLALYYNESEQTPTMFSLGVHFDREGRVTGAGGLFLQALPGCNEDVLEQLQKKSSQLPSLAKAISEGKSVKDYCTENFADFGVQDLAEEPIGFSCTCSRNNFTTFLSRLPDDEKKAIIEDDHFPLELECFNCGTRYSFEKSEILDIFGIDTETKE